MDKLIRKINRGRDDGVIDVGEIVKQDLDEFNKSDHAVEQRPNEQL